MCPLISFPRLAILFAAVTLTTQARSETGTPVPDLSGKTDDSIKAVMRIVARRQMLQFGPLKDGDYTPVDSIVAAVRAPEGIAWDYPWGVTLYGVIRSFDATGDREVLDWVLEHNRIIARYYVWLESIHRAGGDTEAWTKFMRDNNKVPIGRLLRLGNLDNCGAMGVQFMEGIIRYPGQMIPEQKQVAERVARWIAEQEARLPDGTFWRPLLHDKNDVWPDGTVWADDLYMSCPFLARWAQYTKNGKHLTDAAHQIMNMAARLQDSDGVWFHAYSEPLRQHSPYKWGRANGWAMIAAAELLSLMPDDHPDRMALLDIYRRHVAGIKKLQPPPGIWHNILDHDETWEETSCSVMFAYAIARGVNRGWLPDEDMAVARKAFAAVCANYITPEGTVNGVVRGTGIGMTMEYYASRERLEDDLHGRGVVLLAGTEILNAIQK